MDKMIFSGTVVDGSQRELATHGSTAFPLAIYADSLRNDEVPWHWHEEWELILALDGEVLVCTGGARYLLKAGEGVFVNSQILHGCWDWENSHSRLHSVVFHPRLVGGSLDSVFHQRYVQPLVHNRALESLHLTPEIPWQRDFLDNVEQVWQCCSRGNRGYEFRARQLLSENLLLLLDHVPESPTQPSVRQQRDAERIKAMLQYIHDHCTDPISTLDIAGSASVSESECLRCFRHTIGTTPIQYLRQYRIQKAVQLLTTTQLPVSAISEACGFQDVSYFTKTFRETKGCAPTVFRKK